MDSPHSIVCSTDVCTGQFRQGSKSGVSFDEDPSSCNNFDYPCLLTRETRARHEICTWNILVNMLNSNTDPRFTHGLWIKDSEDFILRDWGGSLEGLLFHVLGSVQSSRCF